MTKIERFILKTFRYDPNTGEMRRVLRNYVWSKDYPVDEPAGTLSRQGYIRVVFRIDGKKYASSLHRIACVFMNGTYPSRSLDVDHINGDKSDNRWCNLRLAKRGQNNMNSGSPSNNTSGYKGVHKSTDKNKFKPRKNPWFARIKVDGEIIHLGVFKTFKDALAARKIAESKYFGEYARKLSQK